MRKLLLLLCGFLAYQTLNAESVSKSDALKKAQGFMPGKHFVENRSVASVRGEALSEAFYVFNADNGGGYVIVSGDDRTTEILGYSKTGNLDMDHLPENLKWWLEGYARQIDALGTSVKPVQTQKSITRGSDSWNAISPMIQTKWNQDYPYNMMCPDYKGRFIGDEGFATDNEGAYDTENICVTGCVATAMAQIMYYWKYPNTCPALDAYTTYSNGWPMNALPATSFNWDAMKKSYNGNETDESAMAIATLFRYCGQSVQMNYDLGGSEASVSPSVLANVFGYSKNIRRLYRDAYTTSQWEDIIYAELAAQRPVLYSGQADVGGHQFIVDGYDGNGLFHMNWGWGGMSDDYFVLSLADPHSQGIGGSATNRAFQFNQEALIGVQPGSSEEVLTAQFESNISAMATKNYTRTNADNNFTDVQFNGAFYVQYNTPSTEALNVQVGWALCQNGEIKSVVSSKSYSFAAGITNDGYYTTRTSSFGAGLPLGKYEVCQVYRYTDDAAWSLCAPYWTVNENYRTSFLMAEVTATTLTVRQAQPSFKVNSITVSDYPSTGSPMDVTLNVTNDGETFEQVVRLWAQKEGSSTWTQVGITTRKIDPGESGDVVISYKPTESGSFTLKATNGSSNEALKTTTVIIYSSFDMTINNIKYVCHSGTKKAKVVGNTFPPSPTVNVVIPATFVVDDTEYTVNEIADEALLPSNYMNNPIVSLTIPETVESIGDYAVYNCYNLTEIKIPEGVKHIGASAFRYCYYVESIELPASLTSIGEYAFGNIYYLESVVSNIANPFAIADNVFGIANGDALTPPTATLSVPAGAKGKYEATNGWKKFQSITEMDLDIDLNTVVECIMAGEYNKKADLNNDNKVNAADIVEIVKIIKNK